MKQDFESHSSQLLQSEFAKRREKVKNYSIRALARDLEIGKTTIAEVVAGKRKLSKSNALKLISKLNLSEEDIQKAINEFATSSSQQKT